MFITLHQTNELLFFLSTSALLFQIEQGINILW